MGLWRVDESADYEWVRLADLPHRPPPPAPTPSDDASTDLARRLCVRLDEESWWSGRARRVLLVDLDNLRAAPSRLRARMAVVVHLAERADVVALAGQKGAAARSRPWLGRHADDVIAVADGSDLADHALLDAAASVKGAAQFLVVSNDGIFAELATRGRLSVLSPGADALSDRLVGAAALVVDLAAAEKVAAADRAKQQRAARRRAAR